MDISYRQYFIWILDATHFREGGWVLPFYHPNSEDWLLPPFFRRGQILFCFFWQKKKTFPVFCKKKKKGSTLISVFHSHKYGFYHFSLTKKGFYNYFCFPFSQIWVLPLSPPKKKIRAFSSPNMGSTTFGFHLKNCSKKKGFYTNFNSRLQKKGFYLNFNSRLQKKRFYHTSKMGFYLLPFYQEVYGCTFYRSTRGV